jgi:hypothetical protein
MGGDVSASVTLQFGTPTASGQLTLATAENECCGLTTSDVTPPTLPADLGSPSGIPGSTGNNPVLYISFVNAGTSPLAFGDATPAITVTTVAGGMLAGAISAMAECQLDFPLQTASDAGASWQVIPGTRETLQPEATNLSLPAGTLPGGATLTFQPGQTIGAISCD